MDQFVELPASTVALSLAPWIFLPAAVAAAWAGVTRRSGLVAVFLAIAVLAVMGPVLLTFVEARVKDADDLTGSSWTVIGIDGQPVPDGEIYLFIDAESAQLATHIVVRGGGLAPRCRWGEAEIVMDTDGHAMNFGYFEDVPMSARTRTSCDEALSDLHDRIAQALRHNESWRAEGEDVELIGTNRIRLRQAGRGGSD